MTIGGETCIFSALGTGIAAEAHGVYALYDMGELIYIGRADGEGVTIRSRLRSHLRGDEGPCTKAATHFRQEPHFYPVSREKELIDEHLLSFKQLPKCNDRRA